MHDIAHADISHKVARASDLRIGQSRAAIVGGWPVLVCMLEDGPRAVIDRCPHAASDLASGRVKRNRVVCPLHGAMFDLTDGKCVAGPYPALKLFATQVVDGWIEVMVPTDPPPPQWQPVAAAGE